jgi:transposase
VLEQIETELKTAKSKIRERLLAVRAHIRGYSVTEIAQLYCKTRKTIYNWIHKFEALGIAGLRDRKSPGRPPSIDCSDADHHSPAQQIKRVLLEKPNLHGFTVIQWTAKLLRVYIERQFSVRISQITAYRIIRKLGFTQQRPGLIPSGGNEFPTRCKISLRIEESYSETKRGLISHQR